MNSMKIFNELSEHVALRIHSCNEASHPSNWVESKLHKDYDLWHLQTGQIEIRIHDSVHLASAGDLILFHTHLPYTANSIGKGCHFTYTHFDFGLGDHMRILENFNLSGIIPGALVREEAALFLEAYRQYKQDAMMSGIRLKGCFTVLIAAIMERYGQGEYRGAFALGGAKQKHQKQPKSLHTLRPVFDFIHEHLHLTIRNHELAEIAGMSEKYFILYFKQTLGITPGQYVYQLKMNRARELLYKNNYSIQEIAGLLGYPDPYTFSKAFKKYYKVPPSQFV